MTLSAITSRYMGIDGWQISRIIGVLLISEPKHLLFVSVLYALYLFECFARNDVCCRIC